MFITQIVVEGFKSYKERVCIELQPGLNIVVGKNGAGKSNIFAAIEFVLSNKYSSLRSEDRQRLLHEGSGLNSSEQLAAEVEITFDNKNRRFPEDKDSITLKRVIGLKKDEFLLNNRHVSKTQVDNLLESAGFSRCNPYNYVPQGKVNSLLKMTDYERLDLLKEIAGTRVYDKRRAESLKIMRDTDLHRSQIAEISESFERRLQELEDEQEELRQFQELDRNRRSLEYTIFTLEQNSADRKLSVLESNRERTHHQAEEAHAESEALQESKRKLEGEITEQHARLARLNKDKSTIGGKLNDVVKRTAHQTMLVRDQSNTEKSAQIEKEILSLQKQIRKMEVKLEKTDKTFAIEKAKEQMIQVQLNEHTHRLDELYAKQGRQLQFKSRAERDLYLHNDIKRLNAMLEQERAQDRSALDGVSVRQTQLEQLAGKKETVSEDIDLTIGALHEKSETLTKLKQQRDELTNERKQCWRLEAQHGSNITQLKSKVQAIESRLYSCMPRDVRLGMQSIKELCAQNNITGVHGMLCELFTTESTFYQAVQTTAGNRLFHVVVDTDEIASSLLHAMRRSQSGRITFMPLNRLTQGWNKPFAESADVIPMLDKLVFKPMFHPAMSQVFGKTVIARNLDVGAIYSRNHAVNAITLDGDQVNKKGAITGGFVDSRSSALKTMSELFELRASLEATADIEEVRRTARFKDQEVSAILGEMQKCESSRRELRERISVLKDDLDTYISDTGILSSEIKTKLQAAEAYETNILQLTSTIDSHRKEIDNDFSAALTDQEHEELDVLGAKIMELTSDLSKSSATRVSVQAEQSKLNDVLSLNLRARLKDLKDSLSSVMVAIDDASDDVAELKALESEENELRLDLQQHQTFIMNCESLMQQLSSDLETLKQSDSSAAAMLATYSRRMEKLLNRRSLLLQKKDDCVRNIRQLGSLPSQAFEKYGEKSITDLMALLKTCNAKLKNYSHVNKKAIDQFASSTEERTRLGERKEELDRSKQAIEDCVASLDHRKDEAIRRTFKSIAKNFSKVFSELVAGGKGTLMIQTTRTKASQQSPDDDDEQEDAEPGFQQELVDDSTDRYCGVGIKVSFSGDGSVRSMAQLSGGQQTVVALSLIFAIQRCDPFPFYLFDEIDSALDSSHRSSIARMIGKRSQGAVADNDRSETASADEGVADAKAREDECDQTQFICTTFRTEMLEYADKCFGVYYTNKISQIQEIDIETARTILDSNADDGRND